MIYGYLVTIYDKLDKLRKNRLLLYNRLLNFLIRIFISFVIRYPLNVEFFKVQIIKLRLTFLFIYLIIYNIKNPKVMRANEANQRETETK